ncbi:cell division protein FtsZ [Pollutibacter soli]|uniref:cell division protein FtsZ n=1 Tax=Pollutibacter soli TaxID=3034157 RepID=UPI0030137BA4
MIHFDLPKDQSSIIKVVGVGGGGSNAVNYMFSQGIDGVDFVICNTDSQALSLSKVPNKIQLGPALTQGLGAGANPAIGRQATEESLEEIRRILEVNTKMVFVTAGMGGGTGTGGAPIVAKISRDLGILTVGIVTTPFSYEGKKRIQHAQEGINQLKQYVDTLLVISNDKLRHQFGNLTMRAAFSTADNVLATAAKCITDVINSTGQINVDFADVCTVMRNGGVAILGSATASGENRAKLAIEHALNSPLLNDNDIQGAKWILININSSEGSNEFTMDEVEIIQQYIISQAGPDTDVILGMGYDSSLGDQIGITLIATGFEHKNPFDVPSSKESATGKAPEKVVLNLGDQPERKVYAQVPKPVVEKDPMQPTLVETVQTPVNQPDAPPAKETLTLAEENDSTIFDDGSVSLLPGYQIPTEDLTPAKLQQAADAYPSQQTVPDYKEASTTVTLGGFLARPSNIYAEDPVKLESKDQDSNEEPHQLNMPKEADPFFDMQLVIKETPAADEQPRAPSTHVTLAPVEEPALQDETEEQKRKAAERLHKLRNLSFNLNSADPNNEFENVPAYIRRNLQVHNTALTSVEKFYSKYEVKTDENNQAQISTINTFLDGKKPD